MLTFLLSTGACSCLSRCWTCILVHYVSLELCCKGKLLQHTVTEIRDLGLSYRVMHSHKSVVLFIEQSAHKSHCGDSLIQHVGCIARVTWHCRIRPASSEEIPDSDWFNVFVLHQNRVPHSQNAKNCIREGYLARFLDFVIWGHEHECIAEPWVSSHAGSVAEFIIV